MKKSLKNVQINPPKQYHKQDSTSTPNFKPEDEIGRNLLKSGKGIKSMVFSRCNLYAGRLFLSFQQFR